MIKFKVGNVYSAYDSGVLFVKAKVGFVCLTGPAKTTWADIPKSCMEELVLVGKNFKIKVKK